MGRGPGFRGGQWLRRGILSGQCKGSLLKRSVVVKDQLFFHVKCYNL